MHYKSPLIHMLCYNINTHTHTHTLSGEHVWACVGEVSWWLTAWTQRRGKKRGFSRIPHRSSEMFPSTITDDFSSSLMFTKQLYVERSGGKRWLRERWMNNQQTQGPRNRNGNRKTCTILFLRLLLSICDAWCDDHVCLQEENLCELWL